MDFHRIWQAFDSDLLPCCDALYLADLAVVVDDLLVSLLLLLLLLSMLSVDDVLDRRLNEREVLFLTGRFGSMALMIALASMFVFELTSDLSISASTRFPSLSSISRFTLLRISSFRFSRFIAKKRSSFSFCFSVSTVFIFEEKRI